MVGLLPIRLLKNFKLSTFMKIVLITFWLSFLSFSKSPEGIWVHKENASQIEIYEHQGKLSGKLISSRHPFLETGIEILKDMEYINGKWQGKIYISKKKRWVEAYFKQKDNLLFIELDLGYEIQKVHWYRG